MHQLTDSNFILYAAQNYNNASCIDEKEFYDDLIHTLAGKTTDNSIKKICVASDLVIVPTSLSQNDLLVTFQTIEDLKPAKELNKKLKIAVLPNRINGLTKTKSILNTLAQLDAIIFENYVPTKNIFSQH